LIAAGDFTAVGSLPAPGIAAWDGREWTAPFAPFPGLRWLLTDGDRLVAGSPESGFQVWRDSGWSDFAPPCPDVRTAVLFRGEVVVATTLDTWVKAWRNGEWLHLARDGCPTCGVYPTELAAFGDSLFFVSHNPHTSGETWTVLRVIPQGVERTFEVYCSYGVIGACDKLTGMYGVDHNLVVAWWTDEHTKIEIWGGPQGRRTLTGPMYQYPPINASTAVEGRFYFGADNLVLVEEGSGFRTVGAVAGADQGVAGAASFQGSLYVCGSFTRVDGVESRYIARYVP
jgi:hypothetical protein